MSQLIRKLKITKVLSQEPQETHDETIYFVYFDFDGVNLSFNELLKDLRNKRCVMTTDLAEAFSSVQDRRLRKVLGEKFSKEEMEHVRRGPQVYEVTFSMGASKITNVETWKEELLPDEVE
jgi:hypothetical protein